MDWHLHAGPTQLSGEATHWFASLMGIEIKDVFSAATDALDRNEPNPILFMPQVMGERAPLWDPITKGAFLGLNRKHDHADLALSVLEGVGFASRMLLDERWTPVVGQQS